MASPQFVITIDADRLERRLTRMERHMLNVSLAAAAVFAVMEREERALFASLHGRYVRTGRTRESLTRPGEDAIREAHHDEFEFGTAVEYAVYLRRPPILRINRLETHTVAHVLLEHVFS